MEVLDYIVERVNYKEDGKLIWRYLDRRKDLIGKVAGTLSPSDGYEYLKVKGKRIPAHRIVFYMHHGYVPKVLDHINRIRNDNRIENLRDAKTVTNNMGNQSMQIGKSSRYKGVCWDRSRAKWMATIKNEGRNVFIGRYKDEKDAAIAYNNAAIRYFGEFSNLNQV